VPGLDRLIMFGLHARPLYEHKRVFPNL
jgi:hypothetical protein